MKKNLITRITISKKDDLFVFNSSDGNNHDMWPPLEDYQDGWTLQFSLQSDDREVFAPISAA